MDQHLSAISEKKWDTKEDSSLYCGMPKGTCQDIKQHLAVKKSSHRLYIGPLSRYVYLKALVSQSVENSTESRNVVICWKMFWVALKVLLSFVTFELCYTSPVLPRHCESIVRLVSGQYIYFFVRMCKLP